MNAVLYNESTICFGSLEECGFNDFLEKEYASSKKVIIADEKVFNLWGNALISENSSLANAEVIQIPPGEEFKTIEICVQIWSALSEYEITRKDVVINLGGGMITDLGGFVASTFKRGLDFINIPTTLLSQVDASIGGKTGVDLDGFKNQIGVFADPVHVFIDTKFLSTLSDEEKLSGFAEMLKHGLVQDKLYWKALNILKSPDLVGPDMIMRSVEVKKGIVERDFKESGERRKLNFGHTVGHALEGYLLKSGKHRPHGFCVAWGMIAEAFLSHRSGKLSERELIEIEKMIIAKYDLPEPGENAIPYLIDFMRNDKKNDLGKIRFVLLDGIGTAVIDQDVETIDLEDALKFILRS